MRWGPKAEYSWGFKERNKMCKKHLCTVRRIPRCDGSSPMINSGKVSGFAEIVHLLQRGQ